MLIDPSKRKIELNVEEWRSTIINEQTTSLNFKGLTKAIYKGNVRRFECSGTVYKDVTDNLRYLEAVSFDDIVEIELNINNDELDFVANVVKSRLDTIEGYISIESFSISNTYGLVCPYKMSGYFFDLSEFDLKTITSYFDLPDVTSTFVVDPLTKLGSITGSCSAISVSLAFGEWDKIIVTAAGGNSFELTTQDYTDCMVSAIELDKGANVAKWQIETYLKDMSTGSPLFGDIIDISYLVLNRGGFKLETNIGWDITCSGYYHAVFKSNIGLDEYTTKAPENQIIGSNSVLFIANNAANISNYDSFYWDLDPLDKTQLFYDVLKTQNISGNVISIVGSPEPAIHSGHGGSTLITGRNINIIEPLPASNVDIITEGADKVCYVPVEFIINDGTLVTNIEIKLLLGYSENTWDFTTEIDTITSFVVDDYRNGGFLNCKFILASPPAFYKHAGIEIIATYATGHEHGWLPYTFSIGVDPGTLIAPTGGNGPVKVAIDVINKNVEDYPIFQVSDFYYGIWDIYFFMDVTQGRCAVDIGLYSSKLSAASTDAEITEWWRTTLTDYFIKTPVSIPLHKIPDVTPDFGAYNLLDYNGGGLHLIMKDTRVFDYGVPSVPIFKRTVLIRTTPDTHIHTRMINYGSNQISGFVAIAVPLFSHTTGVKFLGDCSNALSPNVKNSVMVPIHP